MNMMDSIADMLIRIKNAQMAGHETVLIPHSKLKFEIAKLLKKEGWISDFSKKGKKVKKFIELVLKYEDGRPMISDMKRISKSSRRIYVGTKEIKPIRQGFGMAIISTPKGLLTNKEAKVQKVGGEVLCEIY